MNVTLNHLTFRACQLTFQHVYEKFIKKVLTDYHSYAILYMQSSPCRVLNSDWSMADRVNKTE